MLRILKFPLWSLIHELLLHRRLFIFERLSKPLAIVSVKVITSPLGHYGILHKLAITLNGFVSLRHQPRELPTHCLLRSFVHVLLLFWVLKHALAYKLIWVKTLWLLHLNLIHRLSYTWCSRTLSKPISYYLVRLWAINDTGLVNFNHSSGFLECAWLTGLLRRRRVIAGKRIEKAVFRCFV